MLYVHIQSLFDSCGGPKKDLFDFFLALCFVIRYSLLGAGVLGDGLGALRHGVLGELTGEEEPDSSLDLPGGDGGPLVVVGQAGGLGGDPLKDVVDKGVHDGHGLGGDTSVGVDLLQDLVDVDGIGLLPPLLSLLLVSLGDGLLGLARLLGSLSGGLGGHVDAVVSQKQLMSTLCEPPIYIVGVVLSTLVPAPASFRCAVTTVGK